MIDDVAHVMHIELSAIAAHKAGSQISPEERILETVGLKVDNLQLFGWEALSNKSIHVRGVWWHVRYDRKGAWPLLAFALRVKSRKLKLDVLDG